MGSHTASHTGILGKENMKLEKSVFVLPVVTRTSE